MNKDPVERDEYGFFHPSNEDQVRELVQMAGREGRLVRVAGARHSPDEAVFTGYDDEEGPILEPNVNIVLDRLDSVEFDDERLQVTVGAGCRFGRDPDDKTGHATEEKGLVYQLQQKGWALPATGGILRQTVAGFLMTGSAGASSKYSLADAVVAVQVVDPEGVTRLFTSDDDEFSAIVISLGLLGIVVSVTFKCIEEFWIAGDEITHRYKDSEYRLFDDEPDAGRPGLNTFFNENDYARCLWWPQKGIEKVVFWRANRRHVQPPKRVLYRPVPEIFNSEQVACVFFGLFMRFFKGLNPPGPTGLPARIICWISQRLFVRLANMFLVCGVWGKQNFHSGWAESLPMDDKIDYRWLPTAFSEMWVPRERLREVMTIIRRHYENSDLRRVGTYCIEIYPTQESQYWLSPAYKMDVVKIDVYWFEKNNKYPHKYFFPQFWNLLMPLDCRFHWGKYLPKNPAFLRRVFPRLDEFMMHREKWDPNQLFVTPYWREVLGIEHGAGNVSEPSVYEATR